MVYLGIAPLVLLDQKQHTFDFPPHNLATTTCLFSHAPCHPVLSKRHGRVPRAVPNSAVPASYQGGPRSPYLQPFLLPHSPPEKELTLYEVAEQKKNTLFFAVEGSLDYG